MFAPPVLALCTAHRKHVPFSFLRCLLSAVLSFTVQLGLPDPPLITQRPKGGVITPQIQNSRWMVPPCTVWLGFVFASGISGSLLPCPPFVYEWGEASRVGVPLSFEGADRSGPGAWLPLAEWWTGPWRRQGKLVFPTACFDCDMKVQQTSVVNLPGLSLGMEFLGLWEMLANRSLPNPL